MRNQQALLRNGRGALREAGGKFQSLPWTAELCIDRIGRAALYEDGEKDEAVRGAQP